MDVEQAFVYSSLTAIKKPLIAALLFEVSIAVAMFAFAPSTISSPPLPFIGTRRGQCVQQLSKTMIVLSINESEKKKNKIYMQKSSVKNTAVPIRSQKPPRQSIYLRSNMSCDCGCERMRVRVVLGVKNRKETRCHKWGCEVVATNVRKLRKLLSSYCSFNYKASYAATVNHF